MAFCSVGTIPNRIAVEIACKNASLPDKLMLGGKKIIYIFNIARFVRPDTNEVAVFKTKRQKVAKRGERVGTLRRKGFFYKQAKPFWGRSACPIG